jgi:hypothetical protein
VANIERNEWTTDSMRNAVEAVKDKKMGSLTDILVRGYCIRRAVGFDLGIEIVFFI